MAITGDQIRSNLAQLAARWDAYSGSEKAEAQPFLEQLFAAYGTDRAAVGAEFEKNIGAGFVDLLWPGRCLFEMKAPAEAGRLSKHRKQALGYWENAADPAAGVPAPQWVVLCAFHRFEIWEPGRFPQQPRASFDLKELPERRDALRFLAGDQPVFIGDHQAVTREATERVAQLSRSLGERREGGPDVRRDFILQCVWCMFAEDLGQIPGHAFTQVLDGLLTQPNRSSLDDLGRLFELLGDSSQNRPAEGMYAKVPYVNGSLFRQPARLHLERTELELLREAAQENWHKVEPSIFGSLLENALGHDKQWELGAHYTHEADILKILEPTIMRPWRERIENLGSLAEAHQAQNELLDFVVLDPACGSGNFLYLAYRELRRIEARLAERVDEFTAKGGHSPQTGLSAFFPLTNIRGLEIDPFAVQLARVTLWMGHKLAVDELGLSEQTLPLADLSGIRQADALAVEWPAANAIVGNPPYHGSQNLRRELGDERVEWLRQTFDCGVKDLCVYWFRLAADQMRPGDRAGLVGTNSIAQNRARDASLNYVVEQGGVITDAVSTQPWPGDAVVEVSIVNWVQGPNEQPAEYRLDGEMVRGINTRLRESLIAVEEYERLNANRGLSFQGPIPVGDFYPRATRGTLDVGPHGRGLHAGCPAVPGRRGHCRSPRPRPAQVRDRLRRCLARGGGRLPGGPGARKGPSQTETRPQPTKDTPRAVVAVRREGSRPPRRGCPALALHRGERSRETVSLHLAAPTSCFETFPWLQPGADVRAEIGRISAELIEVRQGICADRQIGLTTLYNRLDDGAHAGLRRLHEVLDRAVATAYGWPGEVANDSLELRRLLAELHGQIVAGQPYPGPG
ncbi:MAG: DNA methyltransferase [Solirubrobacterales bacterium]